ncbi:MAG: hypothetical protein VXX28_00625, partial [Verrucomicrobiota bacterium]|nr:hypothetical protein [Verrucomicrobiota bacterium]
PDHGFISPDDHFSSPDFVYQTPEAPMPDPQYVPLIRTLDAEFSDDGVLLLGGRVMADGGSEIIEVGVILSESRESQEIRMVAELDGTEFFVRLEDLAPGRYAYRAYGLNGVGETIGALRHFEQADEEIPEESALQGVETADGWMRSPWFGAYREYGDGWIFHAPLGWLYLSEDGQGGAWLWMESEGWLWTEAEVWPFLWKDRSQGWLYLIETSDGRRMIFDYSSGRIQPIR